MDSDKLHNLHSSPNIRAIQSRRMRWAQHWKLVNAYKILVQSLGSLNVDGRMILKRIINKYDLRVRIGLIWVKRGTNGEFFDPMVFKGQEWQKFNCLINN